MTQYRVPEAQQPDVMLAERDIEIRKGGGMTEDRPIISWEQYVEFSSTGRDIRKYALLYLGPDAKGVPGGDRQPLAMPAEKQAKWWGQGYRPVGYVTPPPPPPSVRWYPSMVEEAIDKGLPIPEELRPPGYFGPTFKAGAAALTVAQVLQEDVPPAPPADLPPLFHCTVEGCARFFDQAGALDMHVRRTHGASGSHPS